MLKKPMQAILILLALTLFVGGTSPALAEGEQGSLRVTGQAMVTGRPDLALITLGVETKDASAHLASEENASKMEAVLSALQKLGFSNREIETSGYNIYSTSQIIERGTEREITLTAYVVQNQIIITSRDLEKVGEVIDAAVQAGANQVQGIRFDLEDKQEMQLLALQNAVTQAKNKAEVMASSAGITIGGLVSLNEEYGSYVPYQESMLMRSAGVKDAASTMINPGEIEVSAQVTMVFWF